MLLDCRLMFSVTIEIYYGFATGCIPCGMRDLCVANSIHKFFKL